LKCLQAGWLALGLSLAPIRASAQISLYTVVDLALRNSASVRMAQANVVRAAAGLAEAKDAYIPSFQFGVEPGYSYGFPLGQPSIFNFQSQSLLFSFSQPYYIRSARAALQAAQYNLQDSREQVVLDSALHYIELDKTVKEINALEQEKQFADKLVSIEQDRVIAGVDNRSEVLRAELVAAQVDLKEIHLRQAARLLREQLSHLTGLPADSFVTESGSIPAPPDLRSAENLLRAVVTNNPGLLAASANAKSKAYLAFGDERQNYRPQFALGAEYSRFAKFNNYQEYYSHFQHNNFGIAVQITIPLFDASRRSKAKGSEADATHARAQADQDRDAAQEQVLQLQGSLEELAAQRRVAQLQAELAEEQLNAISTQLQSANGSANGPALTPKDEQKAHIEERERYEDVLDADFSVIRTELSLLRSIGAVEDWAKTGPQK